MTRAPLCARKRDDSYCPMVQPQPAPTVGAPITVAARASCIIAAKSSVADAELSSTSTITGAAQARGCAPYSAV